MSEYAVDKICLCIIHYHNQFKLGRKQKQKEMGPTESEKELNFYSQRFGTASECSISV